jgi:iron complex transport system substrate-binding protein
MVLLALLVGVTLAYALSRPAGPEEGAVPHGPGYRHDRIICMSPAVSEIVFAVGAGPRVIGVSQHTKWPPEAMGLRRCGGFFDPNFEVILKLQPDLIIAQGEAADMRQFTRANGIDLELLALTDLESIFTEADRLGKLLQLEEQAGELVGGLRARMDAVRERVRGKRPVRALLVTGREPDSLSNISTVGPRTFLHDLIEAAGGLNTFADLPIDYGVVNKETLLARKPEVIVELQGMDSAETPDVDAVLALWQDLPTLPAVRDRRVYVIDASYALIPGPRVVDLAETLADFFHPGER